jgi:hypothetical protein
MSLPALRRATLLVCLLAGFPAAAGAQDLFAVPYMGMKFGGDTSIVDLELAADKRALTMGGSLIFLRDGLLGYEVDFGYTPSYFTRRSSVGGALIKPGSYAIDLSGDVILALPAGVTRGGLRPYVVGGLGLISAQAEDLLEIFIVRRTVPAFKLGAGVQAFLLTNNVGMRLDVRHVRSLLNDDGSLAHVGRRISYTRMTLGLLLRL